MKTRIAVSILLFCFSFVHLASAALPSDSKITHLLVGTWLASKEPGLEEAITTYNTNATFSGHATIKWPDGKVTVKVVGEWHVSHGILITKVTRSSHPDLVPAGLESRDTLLSMTSDDYRYRTDKGKVSSCVRVRDEPKLPKPK
jgi:hypothetical protein